MRKLFSDGWNSFWHVVLGALAMEEPLIVPFFVGYQMVAFDDNTVADLTEFGLGMCTAKIIKDRA